MNFYVAFLNKSYINEINYLNYLDISRKYILSMYPELSNINLNMNIDQVYKFTNEYSLNSFLFNPIDKKIDDLVYIEDKKKIRK